MKLCRFAARIVLLTCLVASPAAFAQDDGHDDHHDHRNHLGLFGGETRQLKDDKLVGFTIGLDYERKLNKHLGFVARADFVTGDHKRTSLYNVALAWHLGSLRLAGGPGFELVDKDQADGTVKKSAYFVLALGAEYSFHLGDWSIAPTVWVDFIGETQANVAFGLTLGRGF